MALAPGIRLGPYEIVSLLGIGGMGEVYRARDTRLDRPVAIKVLQPGRIAAPDARARLAREARAVAALSHPHICALHDFGSEDGVDYLVMQYLEGETLDERLIAGPLPLDEALRHAIDIASGLEHAHRRGFVHRDLKPGNVMVTKSGAVLLDFGLAKPLLTSVVQPASAGAGETRDLTIEGTIRGTLAYMAPEQLEGREADARSDIFAFGAVLYEMVTGRKAFDRPSQASVIAAILTSEPSPIRELRPVVPPALERIVRKCLAKDPDDRWQSAHDLKAALEWISEPDSDGSVGRNASSRSSRREKLGWGVAGVVLLVSVLALTIDRDAPTRDGAAAGQPVRFTVGAPDNATLFAGGGVMALSPDGRHLALVATPSGGSTLLWIRSLDSTAVRPLVGTTGASQPFWSPDSRFLGFIAGGKLKKVNIASGEVQTLCDAQGTAGTWSRSDVILFKSDVTKQIERVSAHGGPSSPVQISPMRGESWTYWPHFLPDGRRFLYLVRSTDPDITGIYVASLDRPEHRRLLSAESQAMYVAPGYLVYRRGGTVLAQRFDLASLEVTGDAVPLVENVAFNAGTGRGVFSASDTGVLAYRAAEDSVLTWFDRRGNSVGTVGPPGQYQDPDISPDGRTVALSGVNREVGGRDIWLIDVDRGTARPFTFDPASDWAPVWSPDGARIAFASSRAGVKGEIYVKSTAGTATDRLLFSPPYPVRPVDWSRDGSIIFAQARVGSRFDLWALPLSAGRAPFVLLESAAVEGRGQLSPDGRWLAYDSDDTGPFEVWVTPFPDTTRKWRISDRGGIEPKWRPDGREVFYLAPDGRMMAVSVRTVPDFHPDAPQALFESGAVGTSIGTVGRNQYDVAPDGRFLVNVLGRGTSNPITVLINWPAMLSR